MSLIPEDRECSENCKSIQHGDTICAALTKRCVSESDLCSYINYICTCCESVRDSSGRTALHVAASCGKVDIIKWLLNCRHCNINVKDLESNYTALHRSVFYGKINAAVCLMTLGANANVVDSNGLTPIDHAMKDRKNWTPSTDGEIYVWGSNTNYTLGPQQAKSQPEFMDFFHRENAPVQVKQVCLSKFHCVIVTVDGRVYSCGHGQGGRLGLATQQTVLSPKEVRFAVSTGTVSCEQASIAQDHSVFLMDTGHVWTCGLNTHHVLGIRPPPPQVLNPRQLNPFQQEIIGICAVKYHTIAWGPKAIYSWGLNGGQLGHGKNGQKYIITPKLVPTFIGNDSKITALASSIGATVVSTNKGDIYVLHEFCCRKIACRQLNIVNLDIIGGNLEASIDGISASDHHILEVVALTDTGNILLWQENDPHLLRCIFSVNKLLKVKQVTLNTTQILFITTEGEAYEGQVKERKKKVVDGSSKSAFHKFLDKDDCRLVKVSKIPRIHRATSIQSDLKGTNYAVIQVNPRYCLIDIPEIPRSEMHQNMLKFLQESDEMDQIHDVIFKIKTQFFPAHKYIIASSSTKLLNLATQTQNTNFVELTDVHPEIFHQMLTYIYTKSCDLIIPETAIPELDKLCNVDFNAVAKAKDPVRMLQECAKKYGVASLQKILENYRYQNGTVKRNSDSAVKIPELSFDRMQFPELYDVRIKTKHGKEIRAHKCMLVARMEYFANLFSIRWTEDTSVHEISLPYAHQVVDHLVDFLYTDRLSEMETEDVDHICNLLVISDEFFIPRLKEFCERNLSGVITLKNVTQILTFANTYNTIQLRNCCIEFICLNLSALLESRCLEELDEELLNYITDYYCNWNPVMNQRVITPYSTAVNDETVVEISRLHPVDFDKENKSSAKSINKRKSRMHKNAIKTRETDSNCAAAAQETLQFELEDAEIKRDEIPYRESPGTSTRIHAINSAMKQIQIEPVVSDFTKLSSSNDFPELGSPPYTSREKATRPERTEVKNKVTKLSQKQRKRLSSESSAKETIAVVLPESPKNPWKLCAEVTSPIGSPEWGTDMNDIIIAEKKQKENFSKMISKPLMYTQMEDKAIEELYRFYNAENVFDEIISVDRVQNKLVATPVWVQKSK